MATQLRDTDWWTEQENRRFEFHRKVAGWVNGSVGILMLAVSSFYFLSATNLRVSGFIVWSLMGLLHLLGVGFALGYRWPRPALWSASVVDLIAFPYGTALGTYNLWVLSRTQAERADDNQQSRGASRDGRESSLDASDDHGPNRQHKSGWGWWVAASLFAVLVFREEPLPHALGSASAVVGIAALIAIAVNKGLPRLRFAPIWALCTVAILGGFIRRVNDVREREELARQADAMSEWLDSPSSTFVFPSVREEPIPESERARWLWAVRMAQADLMAYYRSSAATHEFDVDSEAPSEWLGAKYLASASEYPEVRHYFATYMEWIEEVNPEAVTKFRQIMVQRFSEIGMDSARAHAEVETGVDQRFADVEARLAVEKQLVQKALELHDFLVTADARIGYDSTDEMALFYVDADLSKADRLITQVNDLQDRLQNIEERALEEASDFLNRLRSNRRARQ